MQAQQGKTAFNPIKVLFLHKSLIFFGIFFFTFQSYQGSIFTWSWKWNTQLHNGFQSYQGSIFTIPALQPGKPDHAFNPIKVLFLRQGRKENYKTWGLSILSRFYFYWRIAHSRVLSRDTFNPIKVLFLLFLFRRTLPDLNAFNPIKVLFLLNIFTKPTKRKWSFNPIKVLFLRETLTLLGDGKILSILSRFYFYGSYAEVESYIFNFQSYQGSIFT